MGIPRGRTHGADDGSKLQGRLRAEAERCRRLAKTVNDPQTVRALEALAQEYEEQARVAEMAAKPKGDAAC